MYFLSFLFIWKHKNNREKLKLKHKRWRNKKKILHRRFSLCVLCAFTTSDYHYFVVININTNTLYIFLLLFFFFFFLSLFFLLLLRFFFGCCRRFFGALHSRSVFLIRSRFYVLSIVCSCSLVGIAAILNPKNGFGTKRRNNADFF